MEKNTEKKLYPVRYNIKLYIYKKNWIRNVLKYLLIIEYLELITVRSQSL